MLRASFVLSVFLLSAVSVAAQPEEPRMTVAVEADVLAYGLQGYSGILNVSFANGLQAVSHRGIHLHSRGVRHGRHRRRPVHGPTQGPDRVDPRGLGVGTLDGFERAELCG